MMQLSRHQTARQEAAEWLARQDRLGPAWCAEDQQALQEWMAADVSNRVAWLAAENAWRRADRAQVLPPLSRPRHPVWQKLAGGSRRWVSAGLASAVLLAVLLAPSWHADPALHPGTQASVQTAVGAREALTLNDGSKVTVNTSSKLRVAINERQRHVWLDQGEAFFEVRRDPDHPFIVDVGKDRIRVLGTKFNVRIENGQTRVTVLEGHVRLERGGATAEGAGFPQTDLLAMQMGVSSAAGVVVRTHDEPGVQQALAWRDGRLQFSASPLQDVASEFNRYNQRQIEVASELRDLRISGAFDAGNLDGFLRLLEAGFGIVATERDGVVRLSRA